MQRPGRMIVLEGLNGCGKSHTARELEVIMGKAGKKVRLYHDPGDTQVGYNIRKLVKDPGISMRPLTQMLLYTAARSELAYEIAPHIREGGHVILDRWWPSTYAYQGTQGVDQELIQNLTRQCTPEVCWTTPQLTFFIEVSVDVAMQRSGALNASGIEAGGDRFETQGRDFQVKLDYHYQVLANLGKMRRVRGALFDSAHELAQHLWEKHVSEEVQ